MRTPKYYLYLTDEEYSLVLQSLVSLKNNLIREDRYTDAVDELIIKLSKETVKAEMNGLTPGLDRSPPPRWMGGQGGQSLKVFGRTRSFWGLSSPKIEMGGKALKWLSRPFRF